MKKKYLPNLVDAVSIIILCIAIAHNIALAIKSNSQNDSNVYGHLLIAVMWIFILLGFMWARSLRTDVLMLKDLRQLDIKMITFLQERAAYYNKLSNDHREKIGELKRELGYLNEKLAIYETAEKQVKKKKNVAKQDNAAE